MSVIIVHKSPQVIPRPFEINDARIEFTKFSAIMYESLFDGFSLEPRWARYDITPKAEDVQTPAVLFNEQQHQPP